MCMSLRGGSYYGASLHITIGIIFLGGFFVDLLGVAEIWHNPYATYFTLILAFLYIILFIIFGLLIFRGTEKESGKLLKGSIAGFVALQISGFFVYLIILGITNSIKNSRLAAAAAAAAASNTSPTVSPDLAEIEAILEQASQEFRQNSTTSVILEESLSTPAPSSTVDLLLVENGDNQAIISIYQIMILVVGGLATVAYSAVVIMYFREIDTESTRARGRF